METGLLSMASQFSGLPMDSLIGGPLNAAANANNAMALTQTKFMLDTCFQKVSIDEREEVNGVAEERDSSGKVTTKEVIGRAKRAAYEGYAPIMIKMALTRGVLVPGSRIEKDGQEEITPPVIQNFTTEFDLPLLTIIPLNSLAVDEVDINFEMEVKSSFSESMNETKETDLKTAASFEAKVGYGCFSASVNGSVSYDQKDSSSHDTHYEKSNSAKYSVAVHAKQLPLPKGVGIIIEAFSKSIEPIQLEAA